MRFTFVQVDGLPALAWCIRIDQGSDAVRVYHGEQVEVQFDFFAEGAWNGGFDADGLRQATIFCGTGALLDDGRVQLVSSTDRVPVRFSAFGSRMLFMCRILRFLFCPRPGSLRILFIHFMLMIWFASGGRGLFVGMESSGSLPGMFCICIPVFG